MDTLRHTREHCHYSIDKRKPETYRTFPEVRQLLKVPQSFGSRPVQVACRGKQGRFYAEISFFGKMQEELGLQWEEPDGVDLGEEQFGHMTSWERCK